MLICIFQKSGVSIHQPAGLIFQKKCQLILLVKSSAWVVRRDSNVSFTFLASLFMCLLHCRTMLLNRSKCGTVCLPASFPPKSLPCKWDVKSEPPGGIQLFYWVSNYWVPHVPETEVNPYPRACCIWLTSLVFTGPATLVLIAALLSKPDFADSFKT